MKKHNFTILIFDIRQFLNNFAFSCPVPADV